MRRAAKRDAVEKPIIAALEGDGWHCEKVNSSGIPDLICSHEMAWIIRLVEPKSPGAAITVAQAAFRKRWRGPPILTVSGPEEALSQTRRELQLAGAGK